MLQPIDFYFDFSSPYGYFASTQIDALAAKFKREVTWRPFLLGVVFKVSGAKPLIELPLKGDYFKHDFERTAGFSACRSSCRRAFRSRRLRPAALSTG